jgi:hypothetical protein
MVMMNIVINERQKADGHSAQTATEEKDADVRYHTSLLTSLNEDLSQQPLHGNSCPQSFTESPLKMRITLLILFASFPYPVFSGSGNDLN